MFLEVVYILIGCLHINILLEQPKEGRTKNTLFLILSYFFLLLSIFQLLLSSVAACEYSILSLYGSFQKH